MLIQGRRNQHNLGGMQLACGIVRELGQVLQQSDFGKFLDAGKIMSMYNLVFRGGLYPGERLREWINETLRKRPKLADETAFPKIRMKDLAIGAGGSATFGASRHESGVRDGCCRAIRRGDRGGDDDGRCRDARERALRAGRRG